VQIEVGPLAAGQSESIILTVFIPPDTLADDSDYALITLTANGDEDQHAHALLITVAEPVYKIEANPAKSSLSGSVGTTVAHTLSIHNQGNISDTFNLALGSHSWPIIAPQIVGPLAVNESRSISITVTIPTGAMAFAVDTATLILTSQGTETTSIIVDFTTAALAMFGLQMDPAANTRTSSSGNLVQHSIWITNTGNITDTFMLTASGNQWPISAPLKANQALQSIPIGPLGPRLGRQIDLLVTVPANLPDGAMDTATLKLVSQGDDAHWAEASLTTIVGEAQPGQQIFLPLILK